MVYSKFILQNLIIYQWAIGQATRHLYLYISTNSARLDLGPVILNLFVCLMKNCEYYQFIKNVPMFI